MKIGEARQVYGDQIRSYRKQKNELSKQLESVKQKLQHISSGEDHKEVHKEDHKEQKEMYESEAATLQLTLDALDEKQEEYRDYLSRVTEQYCAYWNAEAAEQQKEAAKEGAEEMGKIMEVARRIMKGDIVPASDEKKLMEFSEDMYQTAKNIGAMARREKREKHDSLWDDEKKAKNNDDPRETAENAAAVSGGPEIIEAEDLIASVSAE
ncbi:MAG: hypothetical protein HFH30_04155 [Eubacterium sp.]|nr:hypothetical protein [Eubacterium sp.]MCI8919326.1 hypothetical protein [Eubacterium sp.]